MTYLILTKKQQNISQNDDVIAMKLDKGLENQKIIEEKMQKMNGQLKNKLFYGQLNKDLQSNMLKLLISLNCL